MQQSLLVKTMRQLTSGERRRLLELVHSPYWHKNENIRSLCGHLLSFAPDFTAPELTKTTIWQALYAPAPFRELTFNNYVSDCLQLVYDFLALEQYRAQPHRQLDLLQDHLLQKNLHQHHQRISRKWARIQAKSLRRDAQYFQIEQGRHHQLDQLSLRQSKRQFDPHLQEKSEHLDRYYCIRQLEYYTEMLSRGNIVQGGYELHYLDEILARFDRNDLGLQSIPTAQIFVEIIRMLQGDQPELRFRTLNTLFQEHHDCFAPTDLRAIYNYLLNYCVKQINTGRTEYYRQIFQLYQLLLNQQLLISSGTLSQWTYTNIITTGIRLGEWEWTEQFLREYEAYLPPRQRHNAYQYNLAAFRFEKGTYDEALSQLHQVEFTDAFYHMAAKLVQLKIYYLLEEEEAFFPLVEATRQFINRNHQLSDYQQRSNLNFLKALHRLALLRTNQGRWPAGKWSGKRQQLEEFLGKQEEVVSNKAWLQEQLALLH